MVELLDKGIKLGLLLHDVGAGRPPGSLLLESQVHAFMAAVLLRMAGADTLKRDS
ncbi:MAG TPA: hypothetical protein VGR73_02945 [Bryobacteraceae bacterium]|nr:hypothetical protein [Bryobacteraceae bacterium]